MNISDIAKLAGVSNATVSRYLNDGYVSAEKRARIQRVIEETGYQPTPFAQVLRTKRSRLIGVIIPKLNSESVSRMVAGINRILAKEGYLLLLGDTENDEQEELKYLSLFTENQVDGVILISTVLTPRHKKLLREQRVPTVLLGQQMEGINSVYHDNYKASREIVALLAQKARNIGMISATRLDKAAGLDRQRGFARALKEAGKLRPELVTEARFDVQSAYESARALLAEHPEIDALFCATDNMAVGALHCLRQLGRSVPEDCLLASVGGSLVAKTCSPSLTTVAFPYEESGVRAADLLLEALSRPAAAVKEIKIGYQLLLGESTRD